MNARHWLPQTKRYPVVAILTKVFRIVWKLGVAQSRYVTGAKIHETKIAITGAPLPTLVLPRGQRKRLSLFVRPWQRPYSVLEETYKQVFAAVQAANI